MHASSFYCSLLGVDARSMLVTRGECQVMCVLMKMKYVTDEGKDVDFITQGHAENP